MTTQRDYYEVLGVARNVGPDELKSAYRRLAKQYHPDVNKEAGAAEHFKEVSEAYAVLSDEEKRGAYDRFGHAGLSGMGVPDFSDLGVADIFEAFFGGLGMRGAGSRNMPRRGADLRYDLTITFAEAFAGVAKDVEFKRHEICPTCQGSRAEPGTTPTRCASCGGRGEVRQVRQTFLGSVVSTNTCPTCGGLGETIATPCHTCKGRAQVLQTRHRNLDIPAGVDSGTKIRVTGEGEPGASGGPSGSLYVVVTVLPHKFFRRRGDDIVQEIAINVAQAALGAEITVPMPGSNAKEKIKISAGTQAGAAFTLRGKGMPHLQRNGRGDMLVIVNVATPTRLTGDQKKSLQELGKLLDQEAVPLEHGLLDRLQEALGEH